jgi:hypothetical protein
MMIAGQAAGVAATIAARKNLDIQDVPVPELQENLSAGHAVLHWQEFAVPQGGDSLTSNGEAN